MKGGRRERKKKKITAGFGASQIQASSWHHTNILQQILDPKPRSFPTSSFHKILADQHQQHKKISKQTAADKLLTKEFYFKGPFPSMTQNSSWIFLRQSRNLFFFPLLWQTHHPQHHLFAMLIPQLCSAHASAFGSLLWMLLSHSRGPG